MADPEGARKKALNYIYARRNNWIKENGPCKRCGSKKRLEVDHINPKEKLTHYVWTCSEEKRSKELKKCQVLCFLCHRLKTNEERGWNTHGEVKYQMGCRCEICIKVHKKKLRTMKLKKEKKC